MKLKTYTAETMAQALAQVRKDLGKNAMILHTRSYRAGSWFGIGGKNMVEITASSPMPSKRPTTQQPNQQPNQPSRAPQQVEAKPPASIKQPHHELVVQTGRTLTRQRLAPAGGRGGDASPPRATDPDLRGLSARDALFTGDDAAPKQAKTPEHNGSPSRQPTRPSVPDLNGNRLGGISERPSVPQESKPSPQARAAPQSPLPEQKNQPESNEQLRDQFESLQKMMGQVLESTRKTAVAVGTGNGGGALPSGEMPAPLFALYAKMMDNDVPVDMADTLVGAVRDRLDAIELRDPLVVRQALLRAIENTIRTRSESLLTLDHNSSTGCPRVIALVGPTGVGKTTTVAKLAATYKLRHQKKVGLITSDTYRIAAVEQLRTYAGIIGLPLKVANTPEEMTEAIQALSDCDIVVVDTAGRSPNDARRLDELAQFAAAAEPDETHLVLSTTVGDNVLRKTAERFMVMAPDRCILTKLDEAVTTGPIAGLCDRIGLPLSFITLGQEVPDDLEPARADRLARCVLDGPGAIVASDNEENG